MTNQQLTPAVDKKMTLIYSGWQEIDGRWFKSSVANLDLDTAYMIEKNNLIEEDNNERS